MEGTKAGISEPNIYDYEIIDCDFSCTLFKTGEWETSDPVKLSENPAVGNINISCSLSCVCNNWTKLDVKVIKSCPRPAVATIKLQLKEMNPKIENLNFWENEWNFRWLPLNINSQSCLKLGNCCLSTHDETSHVYWIKIKCKIIWFGFVDEFYSPNSSKCNTPYLEDMDFSDMKIKVGDKYYPAHKMMVASQSSVFKKTLKTNLTKSKDNCIDLTDLGVEVVEELLLFLYENRIDKAKENEKLLLELLKTGHFYDIPNLKNWCGMLLSNKLTEKNALMLLENAHIYKSSILQARAIAYIVVDDKKILNGSDFKELGIRRPKLLLEIFYFLKLLT